MSNNKFIININYTTSTSIKPGDWQFEIPHYGYNRELPSVDEKKNVQKIFAEGVQYMLTRNNESQRILVIDMRYGDPRPLRKILAKIMSKQGETGSEFEIGLDELKKHAEEVEQIELKSPKTKNLVYCQGDWID